MEITTNSSVHDSAYEDAVDRDLFPEVSGEEGSLKQMQTLVSKLWNGQALGTSDQEFLVASSKATASWADRLVSYFATPPDETSVVAIHRLGEQVLAGSLSNREALRNIGAMIAAKSDLSQRELAALSQLIMSCQRREPDLSALASRMAAKPLFRDELIPMIDQYNHEALSKRGNAGEVVARVMLNADHWGSAREAIVQYNRLGFLELVDGAATPMDLTARQTLTTHQVEQLKSIYGEVNEGFHYNNLAIVLEFAHHYRQAHTRDPDRSTEEIYQSFRPELVALDRKYHSGTCGVLASKFL